jgi:hypothetical protein
MDGAPRLRRAGYGLRGRGTLAVLAAIGARVRAGDGKDLFRVLLGEPFGQVLLGLIAVGLVCFAVWRLMQAVLDADHDGRSFEGIARRANYAAAAVFYVGFASVAISMMIGWDHGGGSDQIARDWTAWLLAKPLGRWLVGAIGLGFVAAAVGIAVKGCRAEFKRRLEITEKKRSLVAVLGGFGFVARAVVFAVVGVFLVFAAVEARSSEVKGIAGALRTIYQQPYGSVLLGLTALGFVAFGLYGFAEAAYRRVTPPRLAIPS